MLIDIGCYTSAGGSRGISTMRLDGTIVTDVSVTPMDSPSWLCAHPSLPVVYAANETGDGAVTVCRRLRSRTLDVIGSVATGGSYPCHLAVVGDHLLAANYGSGSVSVFALAADGRIAGLTDVVEHEGRGADPERQDASHVHMVSPSRDGSVRAVDLGLDQVITYDLVGGRLSRRDTVRLPDGFGPRQVLDLPDGRTVVVGELASQLAVVDGAEVLSTVASTNQPAPQGNLPAQVTWSGGRVHVSNRGADCVTSFDYANGALRPVADRRVGRGPRHFTIADHVVVVAAQHSDQVELYRDGGVVTLLPHSSPTFVLVS